MTAPTPSGSQVGAADREALMTRYSGLYAPVDGAFEQIGRMAALVMDAPIVALNIAADVRLWFPASEGPADGVSLRSGPSPSTALGLAGTAPVVLDDAAGDSRTSGHPWVRAKDGVRFLAVAPVVPPGGQQVGTLEVMDRKRHRRTSSNQVELLAGLAATVAQLLHVRMSAVAGLRAEQEDRAQEARLRKLATDRAERADQGAAVTREQPELCELAGSACSRPAQLKIADSWGDSGWACLEHAQEALIEVPSTFLASEANHGLKEYRRRRSPS